MSLAKPGATFCENSNKNGSWLKKQVESVTLEHSATHAIFLGVTDLIETKGEGKLKNKNKKNTIALKGRTLTNSLAKNIKEWIQCIKDQVVSVTNLGR